MSIVFEAGLSKKRDDIIRRLNEAGVGSSIYYPQPVPRMKYYRDKYGYEVDKFMNAAQISDNSLALPVGLHVTFDDLTYMASAVQAAIEEMSG
jgi:dTDP-4-amino-4,6-dideoxygalactose transaminase